MASVCEREGYHRAFVCERAVTRTNTGCVMHIFAICTSCLIDKHFSYSLTGDPVYVGSETPKEEV